jgi:hypothetical protein
VERYYRKQGGAWEDKTSMKAAKKFEKWTSAIKVIRA